MSDPHKQEPPSSSHTGNVLKPDWTKITVHVRAKRKQTLERLIPHGQLSPWINSLIDAALPGLVTATAERERAYAAAAAGCGVWS